MMILLSTFSAYTANAADDVQLLADEMFLSDKEASDLEVDMNAPAETAKKSGGFFGFIKPITRFFSSKEDDDDETEEVQESILDKMTRMANEGDLGSQMDLAYMYLYGTNNVSQDFKKALTYYTMAAQQKDPIALNNLGSLYFSGIGTEKRDIRRALAYFNESANLGNDNAALNLAFIYLTGGKKDSERNKKAIELFTQAHEKNNIAKFMLGYAYYKGFVVPQDYEKAFKLIKAAAGPHSQIDEAQLVLAEMYALGRGTVQNYQNALNTYRMAVAQSNMDAIMTLAKIYADGVICPKNLGLAHSLYNIASSKNIPNAAQRRDALTTEMKLEELAQAQETAQSYQSSPSELTLYIRQTYGSNIRQYIDSNINKAAK